MSRRTQIITVVIAALCIVILAAFHAYNDDTQQAPSKWSVQYNGQTWDCDAMYNSADWMTLPDGSPIPFAVYRECMAAAGYGQ